MVQCTTCVESQWASAIWQPSQELPLQAQQYLRFLAGAYGSVLSQAQAPSTKASYAQGLTQFVAFASALEVQAPLPASPSSLCAFVIHLVCVKQLDASTVDVYLQGIADWHRNLAAISGIRTADPLQHVKVRQLMATVRKHYKKPSSAKRALSACELVAMLASCDDSRLGRHHHACLTLCTFGMLRRKAATTIRVFYDVITPLDPSDQPSISFLPASDVHLARDGDQYYLDVRIQEDKNHPSSRGAHHAVIPMIVPGLGISPGRDLIEYLVTQRPPSGSFFLSAPSGSTGWRSGPYTRLGDVFKSAWQRAFPGQLVPANIAAHSGRKTLAQLLHNAGFNDQLIADAGGWALKRAAVHLYFSSTPHQILQALSQLHF